MIRPRPVSSQDWATNYTQDMLSKTTGGPEIQGPYARMGAANACDFDSIRKMQQDGVRTRENGTLHLTVAEAKAKGGGGSCQPDPSCIAAFLAAAEPFTYMHCSAPPISDLLRAVNSPRRALLDGLLVGMQWAIRMTCSASPHSRRWTTSWVSPKDPRPRRRRGSGAVISPAAPS